MQTNATVLTHENIQFIKEHDIGLGVSLDGPELLNDQGRLWNNGKGSFSQILRGINLLKEHGLSVNIITVVTTVQCYEGFQRSFLTFKISLSICQIFLFLSTRNGHIIQRFISQS